jgi:4-aminobutyrate aminotransferase/(S)-3-amino-2-methylpropionate transaminase
MRKQSKQPTNQKPFLKTKVPGSLSHKLREQEEINLAPGLQNFALMAGIVVSEARGNLVTDVDGNSFLDIIGGIGVNGLGHSHPDFVQAITEQAKKVSVGSFTSQVRVDLLEEVKKVAPTKDLNKLQLYSSGAEAVESALRLAKCYTQKSEFVSFWGGFHGKTMGALSLMGSEFKNGLGPMVPGSHIVPYAYCYRCPLKLKYPSCGMACMDLARKQIKQSSTGKIAGIIVEPMQGTAGNIIPPKEFLPIVKEIAREMDALLISDEMITGFGRTGLMWGVSHTNTEPDIVTLGKQFGGGFPVSGVLSTESIMKSLPWGNPSGSSSSYGGNPLASAAACASIRVINEEELVNNSKIVGAYFLEKLLSFKEKFSFVGDVRGLGLFIGIEMVENKESCAPLSKKTCSRIFYECLNRGLLTMAYTSCFRIQPAMTIDKLTVDTVVQILEEVFVMIDKDHRK